MRVLVTGAAGFIGHHAALALAEAGNTVIGVDAMTPYYDVTLKKRRMERLSAAVPGFLFTVLDIADADAFAEVIGTHAPDVVLHLAAQAGVRYSLEAPLSYTHANVTGQLSVLEACRRAARPPRLVYASSSSVYGGNARLPYSVRDRVDHPVSLYAATKKANELMAHAYAHLYGLAATGLRFFTVYGPWGRPDMAVFLFTEALYEGRPIRLFNEGRNARDFTFVDDATEAVRRLIPRPPRPDPGFDRAEPDPARSWAPHRVVNIGNRRREPVRRLVEILEGLTGRTARIELVPDQPGDVTETWADVGELEAEIGYRPDTPLERGLARFVDWYRGYRGIG